MAPQSKLVTQRPYGPVSPGHKWLTSLLALSYREFQVTPKLCPGPFEGSRGWGSQENNINARKGLMDAPQPLTSVASPLGTGLFLTASPGDS